MFEIRGDSGGFRMLCILCIFETLVENIVNGCMGRRLLGESVVIIRTPFAPNRGSEGIRAVGYPYLIPAII